MAMMMLAVTLISRCVLMGQPEGVGGLYLKDRYSRGISPASGAFQWLDVAALGSQLDRVGCCAVMHSPPLAG